MVSQIYLMIKSDMWAVVLAVIPFCEYSVSIVCVKKDSISSIM